VRVGGGDQAGQAGVELVALLPLAVLVMAVVWQLAVAGHATWEAAAAARAAARAHALGHDPSAAARGHLADGMEQGLRVTERPDGGVEVAVRVPRVLGVVEIGRATASARFAPQR
jgi:hypothetical protein